MNPSLPYSVVDVPVLLFWLGLIVALVRLLTPKEAKP